MQTFAIFIAIYYYWITALALKLAEPKFGSTRVEAAGKTLASSLPSKVTISMHTLSDLPHQKKYD